MKKALIGFMILITVLISADNLDNLGWTKVTVAAASTTNLVLPGSGKYALIQAIIFTTEIANHIYMYEGTAATHTKISPDINLPANGSFIYGLGDQQLGWKGTAATQLKLWCSANPGNAKTDANLFYKYELIDS